MLNKFRPLLVVAVLGVVSVYGMSALVLAGPKTPLSFRLYPIVAGVMHPLFPQNWNLFAPDPVSEERGVLAQARCPGGEVGPWVNITERGEEGAIVTLLPVP